ncbi:hypothetical protein PAK_P100016 [Pseudomonas phage PAK_P1]|uniref:Uncharacterized protein n=1 Tax=Pseudomonas phage PAK_P1 TaxID=743813 RepID=D4N451_9CAUD|nr:hypothetical protein PAK_P100016 [Pseudomonas phage PAK_P1]ADD65021.1 hypothetical protein PAK_P100016 [Pseudomonas phage PAK_P1]
MEAHQKFSQHWEIYVATTHPLKLTTYEALNTVLTTEDLYNILEIIDVHDTITQVAKEHAEKDKK